MQSQLYICVTVEHTVQLFPLPGGCQKTHPVILVEVVKTPKHRQLSVAHREKENQYTQKIKIECFFSLLRSALSVYCFRVK